MYRFSIGLVLLLAGCSATPPPPADPPETVPGADADGAQPAGLASPATLEDAWFYADDEAALHAAHLDELRRYDGHPQPADALVVHADALQRDGAAWGLSPGGRRLIVPRASGPRFRMGDSDPHAKLENTRYYDLDSQQLAAWEALHTQTGPVVFPTGFRLEFVGALRNAPACRACHHQAPADALLGAWGYSLDEIADD